MKETQLRRPTIAERKLAKERRAMEGRVVLDDYWPKLISDIRLTEGWSQARFAKAVKSSQETVSRWEAGIVSPSAEKGVLIERLASKLLPSALKEIVYIIKSSPFPIILTDKRHMVLAASKSSGFKSRKSIPAQTPQEEIPFFEKFASSLTRRGFWKKGGQRFNYKFVIGGLPRQAIVVSISLNREVYAVVQQGSPD